MVKGKLSPMESIPGDLVELRLNDDLKSNGEVVLKKGTVITGVVRTAKPMDQPAARSDAQAMMMSVEWFVPPVQSARVSQLMIALQSFAQVDRPLRESPSDPRLDTATVRRAASTMATTDVKVAGSGPTVSGQKNTALMNMPSVVAADPATSGLLQENLGLSAEHRLFKTGRGQAISATGSPLKVDLFSQMTNDSILISSSKDFELTAGAQMQLMFGLVKK